MPGLVEAMDRLRTGRLTAAELLEECISRIESTEAAVHAMVTMTLPEATKQAEQADRQRKAGDPRPLLGVPVVVKDLIDVAGLPTTAGSRVLADNVADVSAPVWRLLEDAGVVLVGKANTHEFAYGGTTEPTRNPSDPTRMVGGSSGGPAAALAAGFCLGAVGTDTAGSVRIPANLCGVAALKPTRGLVSTAGVIPLSESLDCVGPMARNVADLDPLLRAMTSVDLGSAGRGRPSRVGVLPGTGPTAPAVREAVEAAVRAFEGLGATACPVTLPGWADAVFWNFSVMGYEAHRIHQRWSDRRDLYTDYVRERLDEAAAVTTGEYHAALASGERLAAGLDELLRDVDVLVVPGVPFAAPPAYDERVQVDGEWIDRDLGLCLNTAFANLTGHPALAVPAGLDGGLPVGVQLVGRRDSDLDLIATGALLQDALPPGMPDRLRSSR